MVVPPVLFVEKLIFVTIPLQTTILSTFTCPLGFTVIVNCLGGPSQLMSLLVYVGVTVILAIIGDVPGFVAANEMVSSPSIPSPIVVLSFFQW